MAALTYWLWLTQLRGVKNQTRLALLRRFDTPEEVYFADEGELRLTEGVEPDQAARLADKSLDAAERVLEDCARLDIQLVTLRDAAYPGRLRDIFDPPCVLYVKGRLPVIDAEAVIAVVGTRTCTPYGLTCAERLGYGLADGGAVVASGMAKGIDGAAARGALLAGGTVLGFLGNGLDVVYPREHRDLYADVAAAGALITEYPPGTRPLPGNFPQRNRILSGVSVGALVVEAPEQSGALITASLALDQGRDVFAVPGPIDAWSSRGCNRLIQDGAALVMDAQDILAVYADRFPTGADRDETPNAEPVPRPTSTPMPEPKPVRKPKPKPEPEPAAEPEKPAAQSDLPVIPLYRSGLTDDQIDILRLLDPSVPRPADELIEASGLSAKRALSALTVMELDGFVRSHEGKRYTRTVDYTDDTE